ncbi:hypothetical protein JZ751_000923 [Albula glossodonta]|uniref:Phosphatidylinositol 5-phosphate 4-kinase type-2 alpha n=1 Tax=Albula glossodonta TaxID=121402 RepID=A0A8T2PXE3_9TELE|nr:hypothetical protein JZ751_000923 [Albula glossodonta]
MYRLTVDGDETYMIVTRNVFSHRLSVYKKYDLKGSTVAREASDKEKAEGQGLAVSSRPGDDEAAGREQEARTRQVAGGERASRFNPVVLQEADPLGLHSGQSNPPSPTYVPYIPCSSAPRDQRTLTHPRPPEEAAPPKSRMSQKLQTIRIATRFYCAIKHVGAALVSVEPLGSVSQPPLHASRHPQAVPAVCRHNPYLPFPSDSTRSALRQANSSLCGQPMQQASNTKELPTYKDNDFINDGQKIYIDEDNKKMFLEKLRRDVEFLAQLKLMDYSMLVGIHDVERAEQEEVESEDNEGEDEGESDGGVAGSPPDSPSNTLDSTKPLGPGEFDPTIDVYAIKSHDSAPRKEVYFMAVIDILTHYDAKKKAAHAAKTVKHGAGAEISTVNPEQYSKRFYDFITTILS